MADVCINCGSSFGLFNTNNEVYEGSGHELCDKCFNQIRTPLNQFRNCSSLDNLASLYNTLCQSVKNSTYSQRAKPVILADLEHLYSTTVQRYSEEQRKNVLIQEKLAAEHARAVAEQARIAAEQARINDQIRLMNPQYEYTTAYLNDTYGGIVSPQEFNETLQAYALEGWRLVSAFTNERGKNASSIEIGGSSFGINSTSDTTILIFERCIKPAGARHSVYEDPAFAQAASTPAESSASPSAASSIESSQTNPAPSDAPAVPVRRRRSFTE